MSKGCVDIGRQGLTGRCLPLNRVCQEGEVVQVPADVIGKRQQPATLGPSASLQIY